METLTTNGVTVSVETNYLEQQSNPNRKSFLFAYTIKINNGNNFPIQVLFRHWIIKDALMQLRKVDGEGVVGVQPIILPNEFFEYTSYCDFETEIGQMKGHYLVRNLLNQSEFFIDIPMFAMYANGVLN